MNTCAICGKPIADDELVTLAVQVTHWEFVDVVMHKRCSERTQFKVAHGVPDSVRVETF